MAGDIQVLIVEDDVNIAEINRRFIEKIPGFKVVGMATTGEQAKDWLDVLQPHLVLLDVYLPDMKGTELVKYVRYHFEHIDIIMVTAANEVEIVRKALHGGVFDFIVKPLMFDRIKESLLNYQSRVQEMNDSVILNEKQIRKFWNSSHDEDPLVHQGNPTQGMPKGIDQLTLDKVSSYILNMGGKGTTAESLSTEVGVSRSTARRYLEYLVAQKQVRTELIYGNVGRPERRYFRQQG
jgi:two-component system CitB family response regulator